MAPFYLLRLFTRGGWVVKKGQNSVYVIIEWPLLRMTKIENLVNKTVHLAMILQNTMRKKNFREIELIFGLKTDAELCKCSIFDRSASN